jgi:hypothetical protein
MANLRDVARSVEQRAKHKLARGAVTLPLPIFDGQYLGRFGVLDQDRIAEFERLRDPDADSVEAAAEFIADALRYVMARPDDGAVPVKLTHDDGRPVRFDEDFAEMLGLEPAPGRELASMADVVLACWTVEDDDGERMVSAIAVDLFGARLLDWMQDTSRLVEGELVGESNGARP